MKVFTTGQVAKICKVAPRTVSKWFDSGRLKGYRIPGSQDRRIPREYLIKFLKEHGMPLGDLEDEAMAKVLLVGQDQVLIENLKKHLPVEKSFKIQVAASGFEAGIQAESFHPDCIVDPGILQRRARVTATVDEGFATDEAEVMLVLDDGRTLVRHVDHAVGSLVRPMSDAALEAKFIDLCDDVLPRPAADALAAQVWSIERLQDAAAVIRASAGMTGTGLLQ